jgi:hypothetical protein
LNVLESLRSRADLHASGVLSFMVVIGGVRLASIEPLVQPQADVIGIAMAPLFFVLNDTRGGASQ